MASNKSGGFKDVDPEVLPATHEPLNEVTSSGSAPSFRVVKAVTRPVLKFGASPEYILIESPIYKGEVMEKAKIKTVPDLMDVVNLKTGEAMLVVCATVFKSELEKAYPKESYTGKTFQVRKIKTDDKDYSLWAIAEIEVS